MVGGDASFPSDAPAFGRDEAVWRPKGRSFKDRDRQKAGYTAPSLAKSIFENVAPKKRMESHHVCQMP